MMLRVLGATPSPPPKIPEPLSVTPGLPGFLVLFVLAVVLCGLMVDMTRRVRRLRYRAELQQAEQKPPLAPGQE